jgi:putative hydrolase of the HAD superfamily
MAAMIAGGNRSRNATGRPSLTARSRRASVPRRGSESPASVTAASPIRAVIFDYGGVLSDMRWDVSRQLEDTHGLPRGAVPETLYDTLTWADIARGRGDRAAWLAEAHRLLEIRAGRPLPRLHDAWRAAQHLVPRNVALARALRPTYRTAILSNADVSLRERLRQNGLHDLFDAIVSSAEEGVAKPEAAIYRLVAERLGLPPAACVFVDDAPVNVEGAMAVGMHGILFRIDRGHDLRAMLAALGLAGFPDQPVG